MHEVLIALQNNLASRIALRYAKQLETAHRFNMQAIHIPEIRSAGPAPGSGWVKEKWEDAMTRESREGISDLISREYLFHFSDSPLKTVAGPEDQVILGELEERPYDFFIEGHLHAFEPDAFMERISTRLYRDMVCPVLMVKNLVDPDRGTLVLSGPGDLPPQPSAWLSRLLSGMSGSPDMLSCQFESGDSGTARAAARFTEADVPDSEAWQGVHRAFSGRGTPEDLAEWAKEYALVVSPLPDPQSPLAHMLAAIPTAVLLCPDGPKSEED